MLQLSLKVKADVSEFKESMNSAEKSVRGVTAASAESGSALAESSSELNQASRYWKQAADDAKNLAGNLQFASKFEANRIAEGAKLSRQQMLALQYTASDVAASLASGASPFMIMMQQGGQVLQVFPGVTGAVLGVGAAIGAVAVPLAIVGGRIVEISRQSRELTTIVKAMGDQAGVTAEELRTMVFAATNKGASGQDAYDSALALVRNRQIQSKELFKEILDAAPDVAAVLGTTVAQAADRLGQAFGNGAAGVEKLDTELGFLTAEQARQVRLLNEQGDRAGALGLAMQALQGRFGGAARAMRSEWGEAVHGSCPIAWCRSCG